jgi:hypothetical protein
MLETNDLVGSLKHVIAQKYIMIFDYDGCLRKVSPYMLGRKASGALVLHGQQHGGYTSKGIVTSPEYKFFDVEKIAGYTAGRSDDFVPPELKKAEGEPYTPPKFVTQVLALYKKE